MSENEDDEFLEDLDEDFEEDFEEGEFDEDYEETYDDLDEDIFGGEPLETEEDIDVFEGEEEGESFDFMEDSFIEDSVANEPFKHLSVELEERIEDDYTFRIYWQSHGFLAWLSDHILKHPDVIYSAYKNSSLDEPLLIIRLEEGKDIRDVMGDCINKMKQETTNFSATVEKLKL